MIVIEFVSAIVQPKVNNSIYQLITKGRWWKNEKDPYVF